jgi:hypothetical protein
MLPIIHFNCRACDGTILIRPSQTARVTCPHCRHDVEVFVNDSILSRSVVTTCVSCGHDTFYVQKDFNRSLGLGIVGLGVAASLFFFSRGRPIYAMAALAATALIDFLVYFMVRDVTVCYSCHALYRGFERNTEHEAFDLKKLEKYGGRAPRHVR